MPVPGRQDVTPIARERFLAMLQEREAKGIETYGTHLQTHNGRNPYVDLAEELADAWQYAVQASIEHADLIAENAAIRSENDALRAAAAREYVKPAEGALGAHLRRLREATGITQAALAQSAGISPSGMSRMESGERAPTRDSLVSLARALHLSRGETSDLFDRAGYRIGGQAVIEEVAG
jgi:DNA-binding XRE family transcriptional regulator